MNSLFTDSGRVSRLSGGHSLGHKALQGKLLLLQFLGRAISNFERGHGLADGALNLFLLATLKLERQGRVRHNLLNTADIRLKLLLSLESLAESLIATLEGLGI